MVDANVLETFVWDWLITQIKPENLKAGLIAEREKQTERVAEVLRQIAIQDRQQKELEGRLARIQEGFNGGFYTLEEAKFQKAQLTPSLKSIREERERLDLLLAEMVRSEEDDAALMEEAEELYAEAKNVTDDERKQWFLNRLNVRIIVEREADDYWVTMTCILGTTKERIVSRTFQ